MEISAVLHIRPLVISKLDPTKQLCAENSGRMEFFCLRQLRTCAYVVDDQSAEIIYTKHAYTVRPGKDI